MPPQPQLKLRCIGSNGVDKEDGALTHVVLLHERTSLTELFSKLSRAFGFSVNQLRWRDADGDLITLASQDDLGSLLALSGSGTTVTAYVGGEPPRVPPEERAPLSPSPAPAPEGEPRGQNGWTRGRKLGSGAYGSVYLGLMDTGALLAVKQLDTDDVSSRELAALEHELSLLQGLRHLNIVRYLGTERSETTLSIFVEYCPGGSMRQLLDSFGVLDEAAIRTYTRQLLLGLEYLHREGLAHRDIKGGNVLLAADGVIKLADFGQAKRITAKSIGGGGGPSGGFGDMKGTPLFMAPEAIREQSMTNGWRKADIWSVGCTVIEMATGRPPWGAFSNSLSAMYAIACTDALPAFPDSLSESGRDFLANCLRRDPAKRPDVTLLLCHPFVTGARAQAPRAATGRPGRPDTTVRPSTSYEPRTAWEGGAAPLVPDLLQPVRRRSARAGMPTPVPTAGEGRPDGPDGRERPFESRAVIMMEELPGFSSSAPASPETEALMPAMSVDESSDGGGAGAELSTSPRHRTLSHGSDDGVPAFVPSDALSQPRSVGREGRPSPAAPVPRRLASLRVPASTRKGGMEGGEPLTLVTDSPPWMSSPAREGAAKMADARPWIAGDRSPLRQSVEAPPAGRFSPVPPAPRLLGSVSPVTGHGAAGQQLERMGAGPAARTAQPRSVARVLSAAGARALAGSSGVEEPPASLSPRLSDSTFAAYRDGGGREASIAYTVISGPSPVPHRPSFTSSLGSARKGGTWGEGRTTPLAWGDGRTISTKMLSGAGSDTELDSAASVGTDDREYLREYYEPGEPIAEPLPVRAPPYRDEYGRTSPARLGMGGSLAQLRARSGGFRRPRGSAGVRAGGGAPEEVDELPLATLPLDTSSYAAQFAQRRARSAAMAHSPHTRREGSPTRWAGEDVGAAMPQDIGRGPDALFSPSLSPLSHARTREWESRQ